MTGGRIRWLVGSLVVALAIMVACAGGSHSDGGSESDGGSQSDGGSRLPARPTELRLDGVDPCALLTPAQFRQLGADASQRGENTDAFGSSDCLWRNFPKEPDIGFLARLIVKRGADYALNSTEPTQVVTIDGFSAVQTTSPLADPKDHCVLLVDVAEGESLWVQWRTLSVNYPGMTHELACQRAQEAGRLMVENLRGLSH